VISNRAKARGYTMIEVLVSMTLLAIGAAGVIAMQKSAVQGHQEARQMDMANAIAREWMERLRRDASLWTPSAGSPGVLPPPNLTQAPIVQIFNPPHWYIPSQRIVPIGAQTDVESPGFDVLGRDVPGAGLQFADQGAIGAGGTYTTNTTTVLEYCVNVRITPLTADQTLLRAEVRVFWPRGLTSSLAPAVCTADPPASWDTDPVQTTETYHFIYLTSAIRQNVSPQ
jgi:type IV pilus assembly protein PilV